MDIASLLALTATFYDPSFDVAAAKARLGDGTEPVELRPFQLKLAPANASEIEAVWLETVAPVPPREEPFLAGVVIDRLEPALVAFQPLVDRFGPPRELPEQPEADGPGCENVRQRKQGRPLPGPQPHHAGL